MIRALAASLVLGLCSTAAADRPRIVVISGPDAIPVVTALKWSLRGAVEARDEMALVGLGDLIGGGAAAGAMAMEKGVEALEKMDFDSASDVLRQAALTFVGYRSRRQDAVDALFHLGRAQVARRKPKQAETTFALLFRLMPTYQPPDGTAPPSVRRAMAVGGERANQMRSGQLEASWEGGVAAVFVNGDYRGLTPLSVVGLPVGPHHVRLAKDGSADTVAVTEVSARAVARIVGKFRALPKSTLLERVVQGLDYDPPDTDALRNLAAMTGGQQAILVRGDDDDELFLSLYDLTRQHRVRTVPVRAPGGIMPSPEALLGLLYAGLDPQAPNMLAAADLAAEGEFWDHRWLLWSAAAVGVIAAVVVPLVIFADDDTQGLEPTPSTGAIIIRY